MMFEVSCKTEAVARRSRDGQASVVDIVEGTWSSGMILASGARGREFDSRSAPCHSKCDQFINNSLNSTHYIPMLNLMMSCDICGGI